MSNRNWSGSALILSLRSFGEGHRSASFLLPSEHGCTLSEASVFGGAKSKLKGSVIPYHSGRIWIYSNPVKNSRKVTDFEVTNYRAGLRDNLTRLWAAAFASEFTEKLKGNVDWLLINSFLNGLEVSSEQECRTAVLRFIWRLISYSGIAPDPACCIRCETKIKNTAYFLPAEENFVCRHCLNAGEYFYPLSQEALKYLFSVLHLPPKVSRQTELSVQAFSELHVFLFALASNAAGSELKTLKTDIAIL